MFIGFYKKNTFYWNRFSKPKRRVIEIQVKTSFFLGGVDAGASQKRGEMDHPQRVRCSRRSSSTATRIWWKNIKSYDFDQLKEIFDHFLGPGSNFLLDIKIFDSSFDLRVLGTFWIRNFGQNLIEFNPTLTRRSKIAKCKYWNTYHYLW